MARVSLFGCFPSQVATGWPHHSAKGPSVPRQSYPYTFSMFKEPISLLRRRGCNSSPELFIPCVMVHPLFVHTTRKEKNIFLEKSSITSFERSICFCQNPNMTHVGPIRIKSKKAYYKSSKNKS